MSEHRDPVERTLDLLLYAPIGASAYLRDAAPSWLTAFAARGRAEVDRRHDEIRQHVTTARNLGEVTIAFGSPQVRRRVEDAFAEARRRAEEFVESSRPAPAARPVTPAREPLPERPPIAFRSATAPVPEPPVPEPVVPAAPAPVREPVVAAVSVPERLAAHVDAPRSTDLPIPGYDALSASQVVERLTGLAPTELDAVHAYENAHRQRRTILGKIEQLAG